MLAVRRASLLKQCERLAGFNYDLGALPPPSPPGGKGLGVLKHEKER